MKKGDLRKKEIISAAEAMFCKYGYEQTSIQDILDQLNISKGSFYHHFISKESLLSAICRERAEDIFAAVSESVSDTMSAADKLHVFLSGMIPFQEEKLSFLLMLLPVFRLPEGRMVRMSYCEALSDLFKNDVVYQLQQGNQNGEFVCPYAEPAADLLLSVINRLWVQICNRMITAEEKNDALDLSDLLQLTDCYRLMIERMLLLPFGSVKLIDIPAIGYLADQIHVHWKPIQQI